MKNILMVALMLTLATGIAGAQDAANQDAFTDDPVVPGVTPIRAVHFVELRSRIDAVRELVGLSAYAWTERALAPGVTPIRAAHLIELRAALDEAYSTAARRRPAYTDADAGAGTPVRAVHVNELRTAVVGLQDAKPDLVVGRPSVSPSGVLAPRQSFILSITVRNQGSAPARRSPLRYFWSTNSAITPNDAELFFDDSLPALAAGAEIDASTSIVAQGYTSTLYFGACIDPISGESDTENNCSPGAPVTVRRRW